MAVAVAVIHRKEREIVNTFRGVGATSVDRARDPDELGVSHHLAFRRLTERAVLREGGDGKYYLDELSWNAMRKIRHRMAFVMIGVIVVLLAVFAVTGVVVSRN